MTTVWVTATVLQLLAEQGLGTAEATFTGTQLEAWLDGQLTRDQRTVFVGQLTNKVRERD